MSINVYWSCIEDEWLRAVNPIPVYNSVIDQGHFSDANVHRCPAFSNSLKNTFCLKSIYDYTFEVKDNSIWSKDYDQNFYDRHVLVRSMKDRVFSFQQYFTFFTEEDSLLMTGNLQPFLELNDINDRCLVIPGTFDIGKWFRNIEFSFHLKSNFSEFKITEGETYSYVKFHTEEKVNLIQYRHSEKLASILREQMYVRNNTPRLRNLVAYYKMFKTKKIILEEIKKNIVQ